MISSFKQLVLTKIQQTLKAFKNYVLSFKAKIIPDVRHLVMWDAPKEFNRLLEENIQEFINISK